MAISTALLEHSFAESNAWGRISRARGGRLAAPGDTRHRNVAAQLRVADAHYSRRVAWLRRTAAALLGSRRLSLRCCGSVAEAAPFFEASEEAVKAAAFNGGAGGDADTVERRLLATAAALVAASRDLATTRVPLFCGRPASTWRLTRLCAQYSGISTNNSILAFARFEPVVLRVRGGQRLSATIRRDAALATVALWRCVAP